MTFRRFLVSKKIERSDTRTPNSYTNSFPSFLLGPPWQAPCWLLSRIEAPKGIRLQAERPPQRRHPTLYQPDGNRREGPNKAAVCLFRGRNGVHRGENGNLGDVRPVANQGSFGAD